VLRRIDERGCVQWSQASAEPPASRVEFARLLPDLEEHFLKHVFASPRSINIRLIKPSRMRA